MLSKRVLGAALVAACLCAGGTALAQKKRDNAAIAEKLVTVGVPVHEGDIVLVSGTSADAELLEELSLAVAKRGADALVALSPSSRVWKRFWTEVPAKYDSRAPELDIKLMSMADVAISIDSDTGEAGLLADVPEARRAARAAAARVVGEVSRARNIASINLGNGVYPGANQAARFGLSQAELSQLFWDAVNADQAKLAASNKALIAALSAGKQLEITHPNGTNLKVRIEGRKVLDSDGSISEAERKQGHPASLVWLPAGEVYVTPVPGTAEGVIVDERYLGGTLGKDIAGLTLEVREGRLVSMRAKTPMDWLQKGYDLGPAGKELLGVIDFGTNPALRPGRGKLESFVATGTVTYFFGDNTWAGGDNAVGYGLAGHLTGCTVKVDGKTIVENGALKN
jgi:leucyl aminopeptidase (aminopeptidase T)